MKKSTVDSVRLTSKNPENLEHIGASLANSLYSLPLSIYLEGPLGAGKTLFTAGLAKGLGIEESIRSPTYAIAQEYTGDTPLLHIDLYRVKNETNEILRQYEDFPGIRAIEWGSYARKQTGEASIHISLEDTGGSRGIQCDFHDIKIPTREDVEALRRQTHLSDHIIKHCDLVGKVAYKIANDFLAQGTITRPLACLRAGELHDLLRFTDFTHRKTERDGSPTPTETQDTWQKLTEKYGADGHELACTTFLTEKGFPHIGEIIRFHGSTHSPAKGATVEQKILFYADKRVALESLVSLEERFEDFRQRYDNGKHSPRSQEWEENAKNIEQELFPDGPPTLTMEEVSREESPESL